MNETSNPWIDVSASLHEVAAAINMTAQFVREERIADAVAALRLTHSAVERMARDAEAASKEVAP